MRKLFAFLFASLDGYHETPEHDIGWQQVDDEFDAFDLAQLGEADTFLLGRVTYQMFAEFWPSDKARETEPVRAAIFNSQPKVVVSRTLRTASWQNTTIIGADAAAGVRQLKEQPGRAIELLGSAKLCASLIGAGLVDELRVMVNPVLLGTGIPAFPVTGQVGMELLGSRPFGNGNILLSYRPQT